MRKEAKHDIQNLSANNNWLFQHMITAFWHGFGISNGLDINKEDVEEISYKHGPKGYRVKAKIMREKLEEYIKWLENYQQSWNSDLFNDSEKEDFYNKEYSPNRERITRMIELLQV